MKQCPVCETNYTDDSLQFCLSDGANLVSARDEEETIQMSANRNPMRIDFQNHTAPIPSLPTSANVPVKKGCSPLLVGGLFALLLVLFGAVVAGVYFFVPFNGKNAPDNAANNPNASQSPKSNDSSDDLNGKITNLQKQIEEQKNQKQTSNQKSVSNQNSSLTPPASGTTTARVAPTGDGFLSLRTEPSVKTGTQLVKIPTGATVNFYGKCQNPGSTVDGKTGKWCLVTYNNQSGWVFDAYLIYP